MVHFNLVRVEFPEACFGLQLAEQELPLQMEKKFPLYVRCNKFGAVVTGAGLLYTLQKRRSPR